MKMMEKKGRNVVCKIKKNSDMILEMLEKLYDVDDGN
jgi:hypothetical protein